MKKITRNLFLLLFVLISILSFSTSVKNILYNENEYKFDLKQNPSKSSLDTPLSTSGWIENGIPICSTFTRNPQACSDGAGGAIIVWQDNRNGNWDIYAQRIDEVGTIQWEVNGLAICTGDDFHTNPQACSDGLGGFFIIWESEGDIYGQHIDALGNKSWIENGIAICDTGGDRDNFQVCNIGMGYAVIVWQDNRNGDWDIYAQGVGVYGNYWGPNGIVICDEGGDQTEPQLCKFMTNNVIIVWQDGGYGNLDIFAQRVDHNGNRLWLNYDDWPARDELSGMMICYQELDTDNQMSPQICNDGAGGAIIAWVDDRYAVGDWEIFVQRIDEDGTLYWTDEGMGVWADTDDRNPQLCSDGMGGAFVAWEEYESSGNLYIQRVDDTGTYQWAYGGLHIRDFTFPPASWALHDTGTNEAFIIMDDNDRILASVINATGEFQWSGNAKIIYDGVDREYPLHVCRDETDGLFITWVDSGDVYAQHIRRDHDLSVNHPNDMTTNILSDDVITWTVNYSWSNLQYRVWVNTTNGDSSLWVNWSVLEDGRNINVPINRTIPGTFNYTIEVYDWLGLNESDTVTVTITANLNLTQPEDITTSTGGDVSIEWVATGDFGSGMYRVWVNATNDNNYLWVDWTEWVSGEEIIVPIDRTSPGTFNYTIEVHDGFGLIASDTILITVDAVPRSKSGVPIEVFWSITIGLAGGVAILAVLLFRTRKNLRLIS